MGGRPAALGPPRRRPAGEGAGAPQNVISSVGHPAALGNIVGEAGYPPLRPKYGGARVLWRSN